MLHAPTCAEQVLLQAVLPSIFDNETGSGTFVWSGSGLDSNHEHVRIVFVVFNCGANHFPLGPRLRGFGGPTGNMCVEVYFLHIPGCHIVFHQTQQQYTFTMTIVRKELGSETVRQDGSTQKKGPGICLWSNFTCWSVYEHFMYLYCVVIFQSCIDSTKSFAPPYLQSNGCYKLCCPTCLTTEQARTRLCGRILVRV